MVTFDGNVVPGSSITAWNRVALSGTHGEGPNVTACCAVRRPGASAVRPIRSARDSRALRGCREPLRSSRPGPRARPIAGHTAAHFRSGIPPDARPRLRPHLLGSERIRDPLELRATPCPKARKPAGRIHPVRLTVPPRSRTDSPPEEPSGVPGPRIPLGCRAARSNRDASCKPARDRESAKRTTPDSR